MVEAGTYLLSALILASARHIAEKVLINLTCLSRGGRKEQHQGFTQLCKLIGTASTELL